MLYILTFHVRNLNSPTDHLGNQHFKFDVSHLLSIIVLYFVFVLLFSASVTPCCMDS